MVQPVRVLKPFSYFDYSVERHVEVPLGGYEIRFASALKRIGERMSAQVCYLVGDRREYGFFTPAQWDQLIDDEVIEVVD